MRDKRNWRDRSLFRSIRASVKRKPEPVTGVAPLVFTEDSPLGFLPEHMPKIEANAIDAPAITAPAPHIVAEHLGLIPKKERKPRTPKPKPIPEIVHTIEGLPIKLGIDALKAELDAVTSIRSEDFGWVLNQGDDVLCVISHGKLTNRALVEAINNRHKPRAS